MYVGHIAFGLFLKSLFPQTPTFPIIFGVGWLDILDGIFVIFGWNTITPNLSSGPYIFFDLTFIDWDHSLFMAIILSLFWALLFSIKNKNKNKNNKLIGIIAGISSFSHWLMDWPMHNLDMSLFPFSNYHFGYNLWGKLGIYSWFLEIFLIFILSSISFYFNSKRGVSWKNVYFFLIFLILNLSPWTSPMQFIATLSRPLSELLGGFLITIGFIIPCYFVYRLVDSAEQKAKKRFS